jgi:hypothetical protein
VFECMVCGGMSVGLFCVCGVILIAIKIIFILKFLYFFD